MTRKVFDVYITGPYDEPTASESTKQIRYNKTVEYLSYLTTLEQNAYGAVVVNHTLNRFEVPTDWTFWRANSKRILEGSESLHVLTTPGWQTSIEVMENIELAKISGLDIQYIDPETFEIYNQQPEPGITNDPMGL